MTAVYTKKRRNIYDEAEIILKDLKEKYEDGLETIIADAKYRRIGQIVNKTLTKPSVEVENLSDKIDKIMTHRVLGIPIFLGIMYLMFVFVFNVGGLFINLFDESFGVLGETVTAAMEAGGAPPWLIGLVVDGIIAGIGSIFVFWPPIILLFLVLTILEQSGYLARAAFVMDRVMHAMGLHGKTFISLLLGFGCNVPAIMATRTLETRRDRLIAIMVNPLIPCAARLEVFVFLGAALFVPLHATLVVWSLVILSLILVVLVGRAIRHFLLPGPTAPFVMELPPYRAPTIRGVLMATWERAFTFLKKAGGVIVLLVILIWALAYFPEGVEYGGKESIAGMIGSGLAEVLEPTMGADWRASMALIFGFLAKEVVIATFAILYGAGSEEGLVATLQMSMTPLAAYSLMVFTLLYIPCLVTIPVIKKETNSWKWTAFAVLYGIALAWGLSTAIFQIGLALGLG
ncbi:ferrous iron transport protein B [Candidatus Borrarchaeum sp.]|uniref:ferrous iron transport protein B n=1 Tax=Candidatus Borrarchaeum sp. TaxID=2846742 RepID=UPI00257D23BD|nr:ferrous iron transport protein B [Candidatus Borrarchaeum sp.]